MAKKETKDGKPPEVKHPLMAGALRILYDFEAWYEKWQQTDWYADKLGLLHALTADPGWWNDQRLVFTLLEIADGFDSESNFRSDTRSDGYGSHNQTAENRQSVAKKAFAVLCAKFFGSGKSSDSPPQWWWMLQHDVLFQKVLWFLRFKDGVYRGSMYNNALEGRGETESHYREVYEKFLFEFAKLGWSKRWSHDADRWGEDAEKLVRQRLQATRPQFIKILVKLGKLFWLESNEAELDEETITLLTDEALNCELWLPKENASYFNDYEHRNARTLGEAILAKSAAAEIIVLYRIRIKEQKRVDDIIKQTRAHREQLAKEQELARIQQQKAELEKKAQSLQGQG